MDINFNVKDLNSFSVNISKRSTPYTSADRNTAPHIHDFCEIYINLSGNVSFVVERNVYSLKQGDIIISKPYEYHHCIYHDESEHNHFLIEFPLDNNPALFNSLLEKKMGKNNHIRLSDEKKTKLLFLCDSLANKEATYLSSIANFFKLLTFIDDGMAKYSVSDATGKISPELKEILYYLNKNFTSINSVNEIAEHFHISISTLERHFKKYLSMSPRRYLEDKKLQKACILLKEQYSVTDACFMSGFTDYSHFIAIFKKKFKTTPLKYKKLF